MSYCSFCVCMCVLVSIIMSYQIFNVFFLFCDGRYVFRIKRFAIHSYPQLFVGGFMSYLCYLCFFVHSGIQHVLTMSSMADILPIRDRSCLLSASSCMIHPLFVWGQCCLFFKSCLLCLCSYCGLCAQRCQCLWIAHSWLVLQFHSKRRYVITLCTFLVPGLLFWLKTSVSYTYKSRSPQNSINIMNNSVNSPITTTLYNE